MGGTAQRMIWTGAVYRQFSKGRGGGGAVQGGYIGTGRAGQNGPGVQDSLIVR
jgi:hypothetical protein